MKYLLIAISILFSEVKSMYENEDTQVISLTQQNFNELVLQSDDLWLIEFYAPWCGHCKKLEPQWQKTAQILKGVVKVGAVNMDVEREIKTQQQIKSYPTIKYFGQKKKSPIDFKGNRTAIDISQFAFQQVVQLINARIKVLQYETKKEAQKKEEENQKTNQESEVIVLNDQNFDDIVLKSNDIWIVEFYAPWCSHCKKLKPEYEQAAKNLKGMVKLGMVDATVEKELAKRFEIKSYPQIKVFDYGLEKSDEKAVKYSGSRNVGNITEYGLNLAKNNNLIVGQTDSEKKDDAQVDPAQQTEQQQEEEKDCFQEEQCKPDNQESIQFQNTVQQKDDQKNDVKDDQPDQQNTFNEISVHDDL